jgi:hypothetical protein
MIVAQTNRTILEAIDKVNVKGSRKGMLEG